MKNMNVPHTRVKPFLFFLLSWTIPGLGHFLQKKKVKAGVFLIGIFSLLVLGLFMQGQIGFLYDMQPYTLVKFLGGLGIGLFYFIIRLAGLGTGNPAVVTFGFGSAYIVAAGLMNYLIAINAYEIAKKSNNV